MVAESFSSTCPGRAGVLRVGPRLVVRALALGVVGLVTVDLLLLWLRYGWGHANLMGWAAMFRLDVERNIPTAYAGFLLLACGGLTGWRAWVSARVSRMEALYWAGLAGAFGFVALDEVLEIHEKFIDPLRAGLGVSGVFYYAWIIPYGLLVLGAGALYARFWWRMEARLRWRLAGAAGVFLAGAVGMEMVGGAYQDDDPLRRADGVYALCTTVEETLEFTGCVLALRALMEAFGFELQVALRRVQAGGDAA